MKVWVQSKKRLGLLFSNAFLIGLILSGCHPNKDSCQCPQVGVLLQKPPPPPPPERSPKDRTEAMRLVSVPPALEDDSSLPDLMVAVQNQIEFLENQPGNDNWVFGPRTISKREYLQGLQRFVELGQQVKTSEDKVVFLQELQAEFEFYEVFGQKDWGQTLITGYYEPVVKGSQKPTKHLAQALYQPPDDLIVLDLAVFDPKFKSERKLRGRIKDKQFIPYFTREEIDEQGALKDKELELCFVDPIDAYDLHTEGSGIVEFEDGNSIHVTAADKNGHRFTGYSPELIHKARARGISIEKYLRGLPKKELRKFLDENPSYVFFRPDENGNNTTLGIGATGGRTIATDPKLFPKGALGFLVSSSETIPSGVDHPKNVPIISRFVLDQDTGGKILGGGRVDLFWGTGAEAKKMANMTKQWGVLYYLVPKALVEKPPEILAKKETKGQEGSKPEKLQ